MVVRHNVGINSPSSVAIGSEMSGGVRNILVNDWYSNGGGMGIRMKSNSARGGYVENIYYRNIKLENFTREAIIIETDYGAWMSSKKEDAYPVFRDIFIEDVVCTGAEIGASISGTNNQPIEDKTMKNVFTKTHKGMNFEWVHGLKLIDVNSQPSQGKPILFKNCKDIIQQ